jgi:CopG family nickel-responsive transcriptional regulator
MAAELVRFGVAMDAELLNSFDELIARRGYATRSEALRDLVRADLAAERVHGGAAAAATLTIIYDHHVRELTEKLTAMQHALGAAVVSTLHVHLDHDNCLEVIVLRGPADKLQREGDRLIATKGVQHGRMVITALPEDAAAAPAASDAAARASGSESGLAGHVLRRPHDHDRDHTHDHTHDHARGRGPGRGNAHRPSSAAVRKPRKPRG